MAAGTAAGKVRAATGTNTDDVLKLFGGWGQDGQGDPLGFANTGSGQGGTDIAALIAGSIGAIQDRAMSELQPPAVPVGVGAGGAAAMPGMAAPAPGAGVAGGSRSTPLPTLQGLPAAPPIAAPLPVPVFDQKGAQKGNQEAVRLAVLPLALRTLFNIGGGGGNAFDGQYIAQALAGADAGQKEQFARELQNFGLNQDAQTLLDQRTQRQYGQNVDITQEANRNAQTTYADTESARRANEADAYRDAQVEAKLSIAQQTALRNYRRYVSTLTPAAQEAELGTDDARALGLAPQYDGQGRFIPMSTQKDITNSRNADTQAKKAQNQFTIQNKQLLINGRRATIAETAEFRQGRLADSRIENDKVLRETMRQRTAIAAQRANDYQRSVTASVQRASAALRGLGSSKDPASQLVKLDKELAAAKKRKADALSFTKDVSNILEMSDDNVKASYSSAINADTNYIQTLTAARAEAKRLVDAMPKRITPTAARAVSGNGKSPSRGTVGPAPVTLDGVMAGLKVTGGAKAGALKAKPISKMSNDELFDMMRGAK